MTNHLYSLGSIFSCLAFGYGLNYLIGGLPPSLYGMMLFAVLLHYRVLNDRKISHSISWILKHMGVCFVPAGVGIVEHKQLIQNHGLSLVAITFITTWILLTFVGWYAQNYLNDSSHDNCS